MDAPRPGTPGGLTTGERPRHRRPSGRRLGDPVRAELPLLRGTVHAELHAELLHEHREGARQEARLPGGPSLPGGQDQHRGPDDPRAGGVVRELPGHPGAREVRGGVSVRSATAGYLIPHSRPTVSEGDVEHVARVVRSGGLAQGPEVAAFEGELAARRNVKAAAAVSSGSAALELALRALGVGAGDEVIIPTYVCDALHHAVTRCHARPVLADAD